MASQMAAAVFDATSVDISAQPRNGGDAVPFRASGQVMRFDGFLRLYVETDEDRTDDDAQGDRRLPDLQAGQRLELRSLDAEGHFTEPPPRFTEASLVKRMEELGIGRPSTYAPTITTLQTRKYIRVESRRLYPEEVGEVVVRVLAEVFDKVIDTEFTRQMEDELDAVASGDEPWEPLVRRYHDELVAAIPAKPPSVEESTEIECPECGAETGATMNRRYGRYGWFLSCSRYPDCKARMRVDQSGQPVAETEPEVADEPCPLCGDKMYVRDGRFGRFYGCSRYPKCKGLVNLDALLGFACPTCGDTDGGQLVQKRTKRGKPFAGCNRYPTCDFVVWTLPLTTPCPQCAGPLEVLKGGDAHCLKCGTSLTSTEVAETAAAAVTAQQAAPAV
jgi:DNA topoisomerase-1